MIKIQHVSITKISLCPLVANSLSSTTAPDKPDLVSVPNVLIFPECHINRII